MPRFFSLLVHKIRGGSEADGEQAPAQITAIDARLRAQERLLNRGIEGARSFVKPEVLADLAAYDETLPQLARTGHGRRTSREQGGHRPGDARRGSRSGPQQ